MSKKIRLIRTAIVEYEPRFEYYAEGSTIEDVAKIDLKWAEYDPELTFGDCVVSDEIRYEIFED